MKKVMSIAILLAVLVCSPNGTAYAVDKAKPDLMSAMTMEGLDGHEYHLATVGANKLGLLYCPSGENVVLRTYDGDGKYLSEIVVYGMPPEVPRSGPYRVGDDTSRNLFFTVGPDGAVYAFWTMKSALYGAVVGPGGQVTVQPRKITSPEPEWSSRYLRASGAFVAAVWGQKVVGIGDGARGMGDGATFCVRVVMDLNLNVIESQSYAGFCLCFSDAGIAVDNAGRMHLVHEDWDEDSAKGKVTISYRSFDTDGRELEKKVLRQVEWPDYHLMPRTSVTTGPDGTLHVYCLHCVDPRDYSGKVSDRKWKLDELKVEPKFPATGPRGPVALIAQENDLYKVGTTGIVTRLRRPVEPKKPRR